MAGSRHVSLSWRIGIARSYLFFSWPIDVLAWTEALQQRKSEGVRKKIPFFLFADHGLLQRETVSGQLLSCLWNILVVVPDQRCAILAEPSSMHALQMQCNAFIPACCI